LTGSHEKEKRGFIFRGEIGAGGLWDNGSKVRLCSKQEQEMISKKRQKGEEGKKRDQGGKEGKKETEKKIHMTNPRAKGNSEAKRKPELKGNKGKKKKKRVRTINRIRGMEPNEGGDPQQQEERGAKT